MKTLSLTLTALLLASGAFAGDPPGEKPKEKSPAEVLYEKLLEANTKQADAAYVAYLKALEAANQKILAGLEAAKKTLNDPKKGNLSITERAAAIAEIDKKIEEVKKGAVGEAVVAGRSGDLLGDGGSLKLDVIGKWINSNRKEFYILNQDGSGEIRHLDDTIWMEFTWSITDTTLTMRGNTWYITMNIASGKTFGETRFVNNGTPEAPAISKKVKK